MANESKLPKWDEIAATARKLGVSDWALRKWAERGGVPGKWHVPLILESKGRISAKDFTCRESA